MKKNKIYLIGEPEVFKFGILYMRNTKYNAAVMNNNGIVRFLTKVYFSFGELKIPKNAIEISARNF